MRWMALGTLALLCGAAVAATMVFNVSDNALALPGDRIADAPMPVNQAGVGLTFDGERFWFGVSQAGGPLRGFTLDCNDQRPASCSSHVEHAVTMRDDAGQAIRVEAMAYDLGRDMIWGAEYGTHDVFLIDRETGEAAFQFSASCGGTSWPDGLAYDAEDDTIWFSPDAATTLCHYATDGTLIASYPIYQIEGIPGSCNYQSGVGVGGPFLYLAFADCNRIVQVLKSDFSQAFVITNPQAWHEDITCDPITFDDVDVIWTRSYYSQTMVAFEIPRGTCNLGGAPQFLAAGDAFAAALASDWLPVDIEPSPRATVAPSTEPTSVENATQDEAFGPATLRMAAVNVTTSFDLDGPLEEAVIRSTSRATLGTFEVPGVLRFDALEVVSTTTFLNGTLSTTANESRILGLSVMGGAPVDVAGPGPMGIPLPDGSGTLWLFGQESFEDPEGAAALRVRGLWLNRTGPEGAIDLVLAEAYSGITKTGALPGWPEPAADAALSPRVPSSLDPRGPWASQPVQVTLARDWT